MKASPLISIRGVSKSYPGVRALEQVSLDVAPGELVAIVGENGAGKSTLMKILAGVINEYEGQILLRGQRVQFAGTRDAERAGIGIIHQELNLVEQLSAAANIFLGRELRTRWGLLDQNAMDRRATELLSQLECQISPRERAGSLRVGDQQLIEIAKALSLATDILIMDEPTSALTESEGARLFRVIERLRARGVTVLYISHKLDEVFRLADRIAVLRDGRLVEVLARSQASPRQVTHLMVGREIEEADLSRPRQPGEIVLSVENLWLAWPGHARGWRLEDVDGRPAVFAHPAAAYRAGVALVTEDRKRLGLFDHWSVGRNITLCTLRECVRGGLLSRRKETHVAADTIARLGVKSSGTSAPITSLSGGNQQKAIIGRWLLTRPKVLLLDDPTRGIDVGAKAELYRLMDELCRAGLGIIVTSSELPELLTLCDRIIVLCEGRQTGEFSRAEATEQRIMEAATLRRGAVASHAG
jgi:ABC-type sugar transport system ATPase subunit